jgi:hypothetical protein
MPKKELTIKQRVDLLLEHGIDNPKKWAAVHGYTEPDNYDKHDQDGHFNEVCFIELRDHHLQETAFLFDVIRELTSRVDRLEELLHQTSVEASTRDD